MELLTAILGAAIGVLGTVVYGMYKTQRDHLAAARVQQFETVRDAALTVEKEYRTLRNRVINIEHPGIVEVAESQLQRILLDFTTELLFECRRAELTVIDPSIYESLQKVMYLAQAIDLPSYAINNDVAMSQELVTNYALRAMDQFRELAKASRNLALSPKQKGPEKPIPPSEFWSYEDERQKRKRRGNGMYT